jgi:hypothetical protein
MEYLNALQRRDTLHDEAFSFLLLLAPSPHITEELWARLDKPNCRQPFRADAALLVRALVGSPCRSTDGRGGVIEFRRRRPRQALAASRALPAVAALDAGVPIRRVIYVPEGCSTS